MAKVKRSVLKEIVKECLLEILFEGIDSESGYEEEPIREARQPRGRAPRPSKIKDSLVQQGQSKKITSRKTPKLQKEHVENAVSELTDNPMMQSIFADTAQTTLLDQKEGRRVPSDAAAAVVNSTEDIGDIFEGARNWAAIAFNETDN